MARRRAPVPALDRSVPAVTLKVGDYVNHHGGLAVTRTLGRAGVPVYGVHEDRPAPAGLSRYAVGRFVWPTAGQHEYQHQLLAGIAPVAERIGRPAVLIPTDDHTAMFVSDQAGLLRRWFLFPDQPHELVRGLTEAVLHERCRALGVPVPSSTVATSAEDLETFGAAACFPVVAKRGAPWLLPTGRRARSTSIVRSRHELGALDVSSPIVSRSTSLPARATTGSSTGTATGPPRAWSSSPGRSCGRSRAARVRPRSGGPRPTPRSKRRPAPSSRASATAAS